MMLFMAIKSPEAFLTFDGNSLASGYHPLWFFLTWLAYLVSGANLPYVMLVLSTILFLIFSILIVRFIDQVVVDPYLRFVFKLLLAANPCFIFAAWLSGLELPALMFVLCLFYIECAAIVSKRSDHFGWLAVLAGVAFLARLDAIVVVFPVLFFVLLLRRASVKYALVPIAFVVCYMAAHYLIFGTVVPASTDAGRLTWFDDQTANWRRWFHTGLYFDFPMHLAQFGRNVAEIVSTSFGIASGTLGSTTIGKAIFAAALLLVAGIVASNVERAQIIHILRQKQMQIWLVVIASVAGIAYVTTVRALFFRSWYYPWTAFSLMFAVLMILREARLTKRDGMLLGGSACLVLTLSMLSYWTQISVPLSRQSVAVAAVRFLDDEGYHGRIGSFNAGIYGWATDGRVSNIDGLVNEDALRGIKSKNFADFLKDNDIKFILDIDPIGDLDRRIAATSKRSAYQVRLEPLKDWPDADGLYRHTLYAVKVTLR